MFLFSICIEIKNWKKKRQNFNLFINRTDGLSLNPFQGVLVNKVLVVENLLTLNDLLYDKAFWMGTVCKNMLEVVCKSIKDAAKIEI